jgi:hypothetical protein
MLIRITKFALINLVNCSPVQNVVSVKNGRSLVLNNAKLTLIECVFIFEIYKFLKNNFTVKYN